MATAATAQGVRCPRCGAKVAEDLDGRLVLTCRKCKKRVEIVLRPS